jgi:hypothetical protein
LTFIESVTDILASVFLVINTVLLLILPRRLAPLPLLVGACYMTMGQVIEVGPLHFTVIRILVAAGVVRIIARRERLAGGLNTLDRLMVVWSAWALISSFFHKDPSASLIFRLGLVYNTCGIYFLLRVFCRSLDDVFRLCRVTAIVLAPVAVEMLIEKATAHNFFSIFGGVSEIPAIRGGRIRAQGPFAHAILAGTRCSESAVNCLWRHRRRRSLEWACLVMSTASSSGPILSAIAALVAYVALSSSDAACPMARIFRLYRLGIGYESAGVLSHSAH